MIFKSYKGTVRTARRSIRNAEVQPRYFITQPRRHDLATMDVGVQRDKDDEQTVSGYWGCRASR
jgi:hypothetical protein